MNMIPRQSVSAVLLFFLAIFAHGQEIPPSKVPYPPLPEGFSSFGAAMCDGHVYVYGGHVGKTHHYSTEAVHGKFRKLDLADPNKGWQELPPGPSLQGLALVTHGGKLYRIGGMQPRNAEGEAADQHSLPDTAVFDPRSGKWSPLPDMPAGRSSHDAVVVGDKIVVAGGWTMNGRGNKSTWLDSALILDLSKKPLKWEAVQQPFRKRALNLAALGDRVYVIGGMGADNGMERDVQILDLKDNTWAQGPKLPGIVRNAFTPAACTLGGKLYISPADGTLYCLNEKQDGWDEAGTLAKKRLVHRIVPGGRDFLLVLGGAAAGGNVADVEAIEPTSPVLSGAVVQPRP
jgi:N-acetylneuraminic acid mutarotase